MQQELKSCPFCGGDADIFSLDGVRCLNEKCEAELPMNGNYEEATAAWNSRTTPPVTSTEGEALTAITIAAKEYMDVVLRIFELRRDGPPLAERSVMKDDDALTAFDDLNNVGKHLSNLLGVYSPAARKVLGSNSDTVSAPILHTLRMDGHPVQAEIDALEKASLTHQAQRQAVGEPLDAEVASVAREIVQEGWASTEMLERLRKALASLRPPAAVGWLPIYDWARSGMDIVRSKLERNNVYLQGKNGDVFRVWLDFDGMPSIEMVLANAPLPTPPAAVDEDEAVDIMANAYNGVIPGDHNGLRSAFRAIRQHLKGELALPTWKKAFITAEADSGANKYRIVAKFENIELMHAGHAELISVLLPVGESQSEDV